MQIIVLTSPVPVKDEAIICNTLFAHGLEYLHLRKPDAPREVYEKFIQQIQPRYRNRLIVHDYYELVRKYQLRGIHLKSGKGKDYILYPNMHISISCHNLEEIQHLPFQPAYCFLSPVFDSISKSGYQSNFPILPDIGSLSVPVVALGGITPSTTDACRQAGFYGMAALGYIWEKPKEALSRYIRLKTPFVLSIAGFDPSAGAGISADLKTFEATGSYGLGICSAITFQNEDSYSGTHWVRPEEIQRQCELQFRNHCPEFIKIGLMESFGVIDQLTRYFIQKFPQIKIVWDPILKASSGYTFHKQNTIQLKNILPRLFLITPNTEELYQLFGTSVQVTHLQEIARIYGLNILWKGGHNTGINSTDRLITPKEIKEFSLQRSTYSKHGTGCVLSAAITSGLAQGYSIEDACNKAQLYVSTLINSNDSNLGFHTLHLANLSTKPHPSELNLQYITAPKPGLSLAEQVEYVCRGGMRWVQLRIKGTSFANILAEGKLIKEICRQYNALFIINDDVQAARQLDADGVHLGKDDMDPLEARKILGDRKIIGATCNTWEDILLRHKQQVDYIGLGPYTFTTTKEKLSPILGLTGYQQLLVKMKENHISIPVFAIGGITEKDIPTLMQTGIQGIALSGLIKNSENLGAKTKEILKLIG